MQGARGSLHRAHVHLRSECGVRSDFDQAAGERQRSAIGDLSLASGEPQVNVAAEPLAPMHSLAQRRAGLKAAGRARSLGFRGGSSRALRPSLPA